MTTTTTETTAHTISTGVQALDEVLGGGIPSDNVSAYSGDGEMGQMDLALRTMVAAQRAGLVVAIIDTGRSFSVDAALALGMDMSHLLVSQPDKHADVASITEVLIRSGAVGLVVVCDVRALEEIPATVEVEVAQFASRIAFLKMVKAVAARTCTTVLFVERGVSREMKALRQFAEVRLDLTHIAGEDGAAPSVAVNIVRHTTNAALCSDPIQLNTAGA